MEDVLTLTGMVLQAWPAGEYDKRLLLLTQERGKVTAWAPGSRKPGSPLLAAVRPFTFGTFQVVLQKSGYRILGTDILAYFDEMARDMEAVSYGSYFLELAEYYVQENEDATDVLNLLYMACKALLKPALADGLIRLIYEVRLMTINGEGPSVAFSGMGEGGRYALEYMESAPLNKLFTFSLAPNLQKEIESYVRRHMERYVDRHFKSLEILKELYSS